ncbi:MAG: Tim44 protein [Herminiimonas sp.]|nr:Tim44 protein [Herminiimonas sp.]
MKKLLMGLMVAVMAVTIGVSSVEAKRIGGGGSTGKQSQSVNRQGPAQSTQATNSANTAKPAAATPPSSPWKGILGGALLGLGLGALLSHLGLGGAMASMISTILMVALLALAAMFIYRMVKRRANGGGNPQPVYSSAAAAGRTPEIGSRLDPVQPAALQSAQPAFGGQMAVSQPWGVPSDFDTASFLRHSKTYFIRLQAAWDRADVNDIREFTTPEMFAEMKMQLQERGASANHTDVMTLDAELMGIETAGDEYLASVKFNGMIKESAEAPAAPFTEVWNLSKPVAGQGGWALAGIQQLS